MTENRARELLVDRGRSLYDLATDGKQTKLLDPAKIADIEAAFPS